MKNSSKGASSSSAAIDRKTIEKNRRIHMKALCFKLVSLIPPSSTDSSKKDMPQIDLIDHAANYIQEQRKRIDELKRKKDLLTATVLPSSINNTTKDDIDIQLCGDDQDTITSNVVVAAKATCSSSNASTKSTANNLLNLPILQVRDFDSTTFEVVLITEMNKDFMYYQLITVLEEEGAEVVNASFATVNDKIFYTVHSQVRAGVETSRICDRLKKLVS
ncbi:hypothetical protein MKW94_007533 [Papaver nudicaule]|uniref:BHLH domain-containing protein n=1 Tax=Papaver nudicaule TaxID=74823 RepID=A0AA41RSL9_PAPNU|nr:hypothetical protein [Papaver nudicaule]